MAKLLTTMPRMIASTTIVTTRGNHVDAIGVIASLESLIAFDAVVVRPVVLENLSKTNTPTPRIMPTSTSRSTNE